MTAAIPEQRGRRTLDDEARRVRKDIGAGLVAARRRTGLSLAQLEEASDGRWKAAVVGSYERGTRGLRVEALIELATFYRMSAAAMLPPYARDTMLAEAQGVDLAVETATQALQGLAAQLRESAAPRAEAGR